MHLYWVSNAALFGALKKVTMEVKCSPYLGRIVITMKKRAMYYKCIFIFVVQSLSHVWLFATPWTVACQASLSFTICWSLFKPKSIESERWSTLSPSIYLSNVLIMSPLPCHFAKLVLSKHKHGPHDNETRGHCSSLFVIHFLWPLSLCSRWPPSLFLLLMLVQEVALFSYWFCNLFFFFHLTVKLGIHQEFVMGYLISVHFLPGN